MNPSEIPVIPNLNFKKESKMYLFNSEEGKLILDEIQYDVQNIKITITDSINIDFNISDKNIFHDIRDNKPFGINCLIDEYLIKLNDCQIFQQNEIIKDNAYKISLIKNNNPINNDENINVWNIVESDLISECNCYSFDEEDLDDILLYEVKICTVEEPFD